MKIVIDNQIPYIKGVFEPHAEVIYLAGNEITHRDVADADALIVRTRTRCDKSLLEGTRVSMIASATIGLDHIDMQYCETAGIKVVSAVGANARGVLQWVGAGLDYAARIGGWEPSQKTIGIVGVGHIGSLVEEYSRIWGFEVLCCDYPRARAEGGDFVTFEEIAHQCDIITFHTPLTRTGPDATYHMADTGFFDRIRPGTLIINSSRGEVIDSKALLSAVMAGRCTCCIDTWENEPEIDRTLLAYSLLATPHIAGYTAQGKANASATVVRAVACEYYLPLEVWYPEEVQSTVPIPISWKMLQDTISRYFDIYAQSHALKIHPERFEDFRNTYMYRQEYF